MNIGQRHYYESIGPRAQLGAGIARVWNPTRKTYVAVSHARHPDVIEQNARADQRRADRLLVKALRAQRRGQPKTAKRFLRKGEALGMLSGFVQVSGTGLVTQ